ncbi:RNF20 [Cordylochernes scorpioides]|uniref:E3 ubiquitin protein ligase n=1 Tax=Cordylochernes scorpioides TaxID=51811 RepID=A0ABY6K2W3_9ARAC|nr:RNF20 [Cordylochernes scorpioides]
MATKRPAPSDSPAQPGNKKVHFEPCRIGTVSTLEEMDMKVLQFQNKKLAERLEQRHRTERDLKQRIEQLEKRQTSDEAVLNVVNRYWTQLNEDLRILLQRFDAETSDESENKNENEATTSFLNVLSHWDQDELEEKLAQRVQVSTRAVARLLQVFDRIVQRNHKTMLALTGQQAQGEESTQEPPSLDEAVRDTNRELTIENQNLNSLVTTLHEKTEGHEPQADAFAADSNMSTDAAPPYPGVGPLLRSINWFTEIQEKLSCAETTNAELKNRIEELEYELSKLQLREEKLSTHLAEAVQKLKWGEEGGGVGGKVAPPPSQSRLEELQQQLEEQKELASARLQELETLNSQHKETLRVAEKLKMDIQCLPETVVVETAEYKCLQSQFSVLYNESMQLKTQLDELRAHLQTMRTTHLRQIEQMEAEELTMQKKLRNEVIQLEDAVAQVRRDYEMMKIEFEQNLAATEQTGPINREMRHLITSLQNHNLQLKGEVQRYKRKNREAQAEIARLTKSLALNSSSGSGASSDPPPAMETVPIKVESPPTIKEEPLLLVKEEPEIKEEPDRPESEIVRDLRAQLKKSQEAQKELFLLLEMYKGAAKETRDKVQLMAAEKKARAEADELRMHLKKAQENERKERRKLADEDALKKIKMLEESLQQMQKTLSLQKQEEEALLNEMEVTGQAFEDMQDQNLRLIQQLREKDDANFKTHVRGSVEVVVCAQRIKGNQIQKLLREEKEMLGSQVATLQAQVEAQNQVVRKLEEKERLLLTNLGSADKELSCRQQAMEFNKRKAIESAQSAADLKLHLDKYLSQLKEAQNTVSDKTSSLQQEAFKTRRLQEEIISLRRGLERAKKFELANTADEVLMEEIREYKEQLTCPSCKVKKKDAVLTKCFHVFCFDCLKTRYETRQRKCPKCNAAFGANDFHRLYLA